MLKYEHLIRQKFKVSSVSGEEFRCFCPWHPDGDTPDLQVNGVKGLYFCFSCGAKGRLDGEVPPPDRSELLRRLHHEDVTQPQLLPETVLKRYDFQHDAWEGRGFSESVIEKFQLGYDPYEDVLTIPLRNWHGQLLGVITRRLDDQKPKYRYPKGVPIGKHLYGAWCIRHPRKVALVEGSLDAIACWDARVPALGLLGSRLSEQQARVLTKLGIPHVVILTDNDKAGREAVWQIHETLRGSGIAVSVGTYRQYWLSKDPAELTPQRRRKMFHSAEPWLRWIRRR